MLSNRMPNPLFVDQWPCRRGVALLLVVTVVGIASVMGLALLSMSRLQSQAGSAVAKAASADALAESGVNLALFYLQNPKMAPVLNSDGYWPGQSNITLGADVPGSVDVTVTPAGGDLYDIVSVGTMNSSAAQGPARTVRVRVRVNTGFAAPYAAAFTGPVTIPNGVRVIGDLQTPGQLTVGTLGRVEGRALVPVWPIVQFLGVLHATVITAVEQANQIPRAEDLHDYRTYTFNGATGHAEQVPQVLADCTLGPTATNPAGVYWAQGDLELNGQVRINGTLLVRGGRLTVRAGEAVINPLASMPGLIVDQDVRLQLAAGGETLVVNGLAWIGGGIGRSGTAGNGRIEISGALIMSGGGTIEPGSQMTVRLEHVSDKAMVPELTKNVGQVPLSVTIRSWN
jgi:hypothetical protein